MRGVPGVVELSQEQLLVQKVHPLLPLDVQGGPHPQGHLLGGLGAGEHGLQEEAPHTGQPGGDKKDLLDPQDITVVQTSRRLEGTHTENLGQH